MPIEIRELVLLANITQENGQAASAAASRSNNSQSPAEELVNTCVEKVLEILKEKNGR